MSNIDVSHPHQPAATSSVIPATLTVFARRIKNFIEPLSLSLEDVYTALIPRDSFLCAEFLREPTDGWYSIPVCLMTAGDTIINTVDSHLRSPLDRPLTFECTNHSISNGSAHCIKGRYSLGKRTKQCMRGPSCDLSVARSVQDDLAAFGEPVYWNGTALPAFSTATQYYCRLVKQGQTPSIVLKLYKPNVTSTLQLPDKSTAIDLTLTSAGMRSQWLSPADTMWPLADTGCASVEIAGKEFLFRDFANRKVILGSRLRATNLTLPDGTRFP